MSKYFFISSLIFPFHLPWGRSLVSGFEAGRSKGTGQSGPSGGGSPCRAAACCPDNSLSLEMSHDLIVGIPRDILARCVPHRAQIRLELGIGEAGSPGDCV